RTRRIDGQARPMQIETIGDAIGGDAQYAAGGAVDVDVGALVGTRLQQLVVVSRDPDEHPCRRAAQRPRYLAPVFERLPRRFEQEPLLGTHECRFAWGNAEESRVEAVDLVDEPAPSSNRFSGSARSRVVV